MTPGCSCHFPGASSTHTPTTELLDPVGSGLVIPTGTPFQVLTGWMFPFTEHKTLLQSHRNPLGIDIPLPAGQAFVPKGFPCLVSLFPCRESRGSRPHPRASASLTVPAQTLCRRSLPAPAASPCPNPELFPRSEAQVGPQPSLEPSPTLCTPSKMSTTRPATLPPHPTACPRSWPWPMNPPG